MRILVIGGTGFIASQIICELEKNGHEVILGVRKKPKNSLKNKVIFCDLNTDIHPDIWFPRLKDMDIVINAAGILQSSRRDSIRAIQTFAPKALFEACEKSSIKRVIHISAIGADEAAGTEYAASKKESEDYLRQHRTLDWVIVRPSLVFATGSYGGTSLMRGMAATPFFIGVPGFANPSFQPVFIEDLARAIRVLCEKSEKIQGTFDLTGPEQVPIRSLLLKLRKWLGFRKAFLLPVPRWAMNAVTRLGDFFGGPLNSTSLKMMLYGNVTTSEKMQRCHAYIGFTPRGFTEMLEQLPSYVQDRWHARLYFLRPLLKIVLLLFWIGFIFTLLRHHLHWYELWKYLPAFVATLILFAIYKER
jgi:nucleoside-diphosphate-sugar epimerase